MRNKWSSLLSGKRSPEDDGVGKSCLCSRLVNPAEHEYELIGDDHSSVYSHQEFQQKVINGDHFLYHGSAERKFPNVTVEVNVVEHTEILDGGADGKGANPEPFVPPNYKSYDDRVLSSKLSSSGKRVYKSHKDTCNASADKSRSQTFPSEWKPSHYVLVLDPTTSPSSQARQRALVARLCSSLGKRCEKAVLAITKCDKLPPEEVAVKERENEGMSAMLQVPVMCVSATQNININELVLQLANRGKSAKSAPIPSYATSELMQRRLIEDATLVLAKAMKRRILKFETVWETAEKELASESAFLQVCSLAGRGAGRGAFQERLLEIKLDVVKAMVKEEARQASKDDYGAVAAHLLVQRADDIKQSLSEHPEFARPSCDIDPYMKVTRQQLCTTLGIDASTVPSTSVDEVGYVKFVRPPESAAKSKMPGSTNAEPIPPRRGTYESTTPAQRNPRTSYESTQSMGMQPPPLPGETTPVAQEKYVRNAGPRPDAPPESTYDNRNHQPDRTYGVRPSQLPGGDSPSTARKPYEHRSLLRTDSGGQGPSSASPIPDMKVPPSKSSTSPGVSRLPAGFATLPRPRPGQQQLKPFNIPGSSSSIPRLRSAPNSSPYEPHKVQFDPNNRAPSPSPNSAPRPVPRVPITEEEAQAKQEEKDEAAGYITFTSEGPAVEDEDQIYDHVEGDVGAEEGPVGEDGESIYVRGNKPAPCAIDDDVYDDIEFIEGDLAGEDPEEIDPYSQYLGGVNDCDEEDPYAKANIRLPSVKKMSGAVEYGHYKSPRPANAQPDEDKGEDNCIYDKPLLSDGPRLPDSGGKSTPNWKRNNAARWRSDKEDVQNNAAQQPDENPYDRTLHSPLMTSRSPEEEISNPADAYHHARPVDYFQGEQELAGQGDGGDSSDDVYDSVADATYMNVEQMQFGASNPRDWQKSAQPKMPKPAPRVSGKRPNEIARLGTSQVGNQSSVPPPLPCEEDPAAGNIPPPLPDMGTDTETDNLSTGIAKLALIFSTETKRSKSPRPGPPTNLKTSPPPLPADPNSDNPTLPPPLPSEGNEAPPPLPPDEDTDPIPLPPPPDDSPMPVVVKLPLTAGLRQRSATSPSSPPPLPPDEPSIRPGPRPLPKEKSRPVSVGGVPPPLPGEEDGLQHWEPTSPPPLPCEENPRQVRLASFSGSPPPLPPDEDKGDSPLPSATFRATRSPPTLPSEEQERLPASRRPQPSSNGNRIPAPKNKPTTLPRQRK